MPFYTYTYYTDHDGERFGIINGVTTMQSNLKRGALVQDAYGEVHVVAFVRDGFAFVRNRAMPFYTYTYYTDHDGERFVLIEYDNLMCDYPFATEFCVYI